jgi:uncharacterized protein (DUF302 family)
MTMPAIKRELTTSYDDLLTTVPEALATEGFGVLTQIDVQQTLKKKIGADFRRYMILGACNPALAHQALQVDIDVGVLLPCNVVIYEKDDGGTVISAVDPVQAIGVFGDEALREAAVEVRTRLARALERLR